MPYQYFTTPYKESNWNPKLLPDIVVSFGGIPENTENTRGKYDSDYIKLSDGFFSVYLIEQQYKTENYLNSYKTITFEKDDIFREILLKVKPKELSIKVYDRMGICIRSFNMFNVKYKKSGEDSIKIKFEKFEDKYF